MALGLVIAIGACASFTCSALSLRAKWFVALPSDDRWHLRPTPVTGGLALLAGFLAALATAALVGHRDEELGYLALAGVAAFSLGLCDDARVIGPRAKFVGQLALASATVAVIRPTWLPVAAAAPVGAFVLVASMNSFNLLDNIDGLAAGTAAIAAATLALVAWIESDWLVSLSASAIAGTAAGFLPLNYRRGKPAALFMGDSGSHLLGLLVGACALLASSRGATSVSATVVAPLLILALPILDTSLVIVVRLVEGRPIWRGGRDHLSHRLVYAGMSERQAVAALLGIAGMCGGAALAVDEIRDPLVTGAAVGAIFALLVAFGSRLALLRGKPVAMPRAARAEPMLQRPREHARAG